METRFEVFEVFGCVCVWVSDCGGGVDGGEI